MDTKFTPGPWVIRNWGGDDWPDNRVSIASTDNSEALFINARYANNVEANAHLIAASPDLYAMLHALRFNMEVDVFEYFTEIDELLAKARGEQ